QGAYEFRTDRWRELYGKRIEDFLVKLKDKNVPIFVVGMPSMRNPKLSTDVVYLNEILAERTRKVGGYYVDVWDGFVNETGDFMAARWQSARCWSRQAFRRRSDRRTDPCRRNPRRTRRRACRRFPLAAAGRGVARIAAIRLKSTAARQGSAALAQRGSVVDP